MLFSSSSAALSFGFSHLLNAQFALVFGLCCMAASLIGVLIVSRIVERSGNVRTLDIHLHSCSQGSTDVDFGVTAAWIPRDHC